MARELMVRLLGDSRSLERAYAKAEASSKRFNRTMTAQAKASSAAFLGFTPGQIGAVGLGVGLKTAVDAASDLNEQMNRSRVVFGASADAVEKWSGTLATGFGVSRREALKAAGDFGTMFQTIGLADQPASDMSRRLVELGADMASFNNADPSDMLDRLRSGLAGEAEPLRRFGVLLSEARVKQEAYSSGLAAHGAVLTEQQKVQARYNLILKDTTVQQGDANRTGDALAGQQRRLKAQMDDLAASAGNQVVPALTDLTASLNQVIGAMEDLNNVPVPKVLGGGEGGGGLFGMVAKQIKDGLNFQYPFIANIKKTLDLLNQKPAAGSYGAGLFAPRQAPFGMNFGAIAAGGAAQPFGGKAQKQFKFGGASVPSTEQRNQWFDQVIGRQLTDVQDISTLRGQIARLKEISGHLRARIAVTKDITRQRNLEDQVKVIARQTRGLQEDIAAKVAADAAKIAADAKEAAAKLDEARRAAIEESFGWLDLSIARAATTKTMKDDLAAYRDQEAAIRAQIKLQGHTLALETQLFELQQDRADAVAKQAAATKAAADKRRQDAADAKAKATETRMGWLDFAVERAGATKTVKDDMRAYRALEAALVGRIAQEGRTLELVTELWRTRQKIADLNKKHADVDPLAGLMQVSSKKLAAILGAGTGISARGQARLGANIAGAEIQPLHIHVEIDKREIGRAVTGQQARDSKRTGYQTSGFRG